MTPAESAQPVSAQAVGLPEELLQDGEWILLAVKPSGWFVWLVSAPVLLLAAGVMLGAWLAGEFAPAVLPCQQQLIGLVCLGAVSLRLALGLLQWQGRLYVLTNRRMLRVKGLLRPDVFHAPLKKVSAVTLHATAGQRSTGVATLVFDVEGRTVPESAWEHISHPDDVEHTVAQALRQAH